MYAERDIMSITETTFAPAMPQPYRRFVVTGSQIRAARALLGWHQVELCRRSGVSRATLHNFEAGKSDPAYSTIDRLVGALEAAGVEMIDAGRVSRARGVGVRLRE
jgi:transcriptional regulator with XRE-family HTH domain